MSGKAKILLIVPAIVSISISVYAALYFCKQCNPAKTPREVSILLEGYKESAKRCNKTYYSEAFAVNKECLAALAFRSKLNGKISGSNLTELNSFHFASIMMRNTFIESMREHGCNKACKRIAVGEL